jgi:hypothetical protein
MLGIRFWTAVWVSFVANAVSAILGFSVTRLPLIALLMNPVLIVICFLQRKSIPAYICSVIIASLLPLLALLLVALISHSRGTQFYPAEALWFPLGVLSAFGISVYIEGATIKGLLKRADIWRPVFFGNVATYLLLVAVTAGAFAGY